MNFIRFRLRWCNRLLTLARKEMCLHYKVWRKSNALFKMNSWDCKTAPNSLLSTLFSTRNNIWVKTLSHCQLRGTWLKSHIQLWKLHTRKEFTKSNLTNSMLNILSDLDSRAGCNTLSTATLEWSSTSVPPFLSQNCQILQPKKRRSSTRNLFKMTLSSKMPWTETIFHLAKVGRASTINQPSSQRN